MHRSPAEQGKYTENSVGWYSALYQQPLEQLIPRDPFDELIAMLNEGRAFSFARYGDGEFAVIFGVTGENCDGHPYHPDLGSRLRGIVESRPAYLMGLQPMAPLVHGMRHVQAISEGIKWVLADCFHLASFEARLGRFFDALSRRSVTLVAPQHLHALSAKRGWDHQVVPGRDCWADYPEILERLKRQIPSSGDVLLFSASMMSNVLIDDLYRVNPDNTYIDTGSVLDPYVGVHSRGYVRFFGEEALRQFEIYGTVTSAR